MSKYDNLIFVDVEALGRSPVNGTMTEFGAVHYGSRRTFHGRLWDAVPSKENPAVPEIPPGAEHYDEHKVMQEFAEWIKEVVRGRPTFVSDNPAYDFMWIAGYFDKAGMDNPFGHSGRRIGDFWAGLKGDWSDTQKWKQYRVTEHDHNPVHDSMGNVEAFQRILLDHCKEIR